jgi:hypothetical protein
VLLPRRCERRVDHEIEIDANDLIVSSVQRAAAVEGQPTCWTALLLRTRTIAAAELLLAVNAVIVDGLRAASKWGLEASVAAR